MPDTNLMAAPWRHTQARVRLLQQAHADHIESIYQGHMQRPGNPDSIEISRFGATRCFVSNRDRLENRAIFTGNESAQEFDQVLSFFAAHQKTCYIEINPANFYRTEPFSWDSEVLPLLVDKGCKIEGFRCVWVCDRPIAAATDGPRIERFEPEQIEQCIPLVQRVEEEQEQVWERRLAGLRHGESGAGWYHYVGYDDDRPVSTGTLFVNGSIGYLAWWYTHPDYRRRGHQSIGIQRRTADAFALGCDLAFTVTDFSIQSSLNLQRFGFQLAYNYILLVYG